ncbi:MAG: endopeptidase La [Oscillospiraceae bacterium]
MSVTYTENIKRLPMLALRGVVVFPKTVIHFDVGRKKSIFALDEAMNNDQTIFLLTQRDAVEEEPERKDLYTVGVIAKVRQLVRLPGGAVRVLVEGIKRAKCMKFISTVETYYADCETLTDTVPRCKKIYSDALIRHTRNQFDEYASLAPKMPPDVISTVASSENMGHLADYIASNIVADVDDKQFILEQLNPLTRLKSLAELLEREKEILEIDLTISQTVQEKMNQNQREYYLREQLKAIGDELYGEDNPAEEADEYFSKIEELNAGNEIKDKLKTEVSKLSKMPSGSHEATVVRNYLDACLELPWGIFCNSKIDLQKSKKILDADHYGLQKIKERMLEMLAVRSLVPDFKGQIICLVGPPGVGKTSIVKAVAKCMGRKYARVSLGGISDEAEIRGHRKTYIGAMSGRIINAIKQSGSSNPVILLDEIDKLGAAGYKGNPSSALLEALDSEQNYAFVDHYIDMPFDLSHVLFITTANSLDTIESPLLDRMEIIELSSYTREDKFHIAKEHLIKQQATAHGLSAKTFRLADDAIYKIIDVYTREAGVRKLKRAIASLCRKAAAKLVGEEMKKVTINADNIGEFLGTEKYKSNVISKSDEVGLVNGLAWTSVGGEIMQLEVVAVKGTGKLELTGSLGDVMQESAKTAVTYVRSIADMLLINSDFYKTMDVHINATEAAVPKDGPSAGVTMVTALVSCLTGVAVRRDVAMTGEISLRGRVLPIGGLREKSMAAYKTGIKTVFIPADNVPNLEEIDEEVRNNVNFVAVENVSEILQNALTGDVFDLKKPLKSQYIFDMKNQDSVAVSRQ